MTNTKNLLLQTITAAGYQASDFDLKATLKRIANYNDAVSEGEYEGEALDIETAIEWLDETSNFPTYVLAKL